MDKDSRGDILAPLGSDQQAHPGHLLLLGERSEPVRDWLKRLPAEERLIVGQDLAAVEFGWPVGMPICQSMGDGRWESRSSLPSKRIARVLVCFWKSQIVLLHGFIKKTQKTPPADLALARSRKQEVQR